ncbi:MAG: O-antigen polymerase [Bacilli bacterium]
MVRTDRKHFIVDVVIYLFCFAMVLLLLFSFDYSKSKFEVVFSFLINGILFSFFIIYTKKNFSPIRIFNIFSFFFMFIAPLSQYLSNVVLWNSTGSIVTYTSNDYFTTNILVFIFSLVVNLFALINYKENKKQSKKINMNYPLLYIISIIFTLLFFFLEKSESFKALEISSMVEMFCGFVPVSLYMVDYINNDAKGLYIKKHNLLFIIEIIIIFFPFSGEIGRWLLFGCYLSLFTLIFAKSRYKSIVFLIFIIGFFYIFSAFNFFKANDFSDILSFSFNSTTAFNSVDFDAFQMIMMTIKYCDLNGFCYGWNLFSGLFSFIPRSIWTSKAIMSGAIVTSYFGSSFTNISCPLIAEFYYAFSYFGVAIGSVLTGLFFRLIEKNSNHGIFGRGLYCLITGLLIFILRGAFLPTVSHSYWIILAFIFALICSHLFSFNKKINNTKVLTYKRDY